MTSAKRMPVAKLPRTIPAGIIKLEYFLSFFIAVCVLSFVVLMISRFNRQKYYSNSEIILTIISNQLIIKDKIFTHIVNFQHPYVVEPVHLLLRNSTDIDRKQSFVILLPAKFAIGAKQANCSAFAQLE